MQITKVTAGVYEYEFDITFRTQSCYSGSKPNPVKTGRCKVRLDDVKSTFDSDIDKDVRWTYSLQVVNDDGDVIFTERDCYPFALKKHAVEYFKTLESDTDTIFYY